MKNFIAFCIISFSLLCTALFGFLFAQCIKSYAEFDYDYTELLCRELTLTGYEEDYYYKTGTSYRLYFEESDEPLVINNITSKKLDKKALTVLKEGQALKVYTPQDDPNDICELSSDSVTLLHLSDYNKVNRSNQTIGMILCPIMIAFSLGLLLYSVCMLKYDKHPGKFNEVELVYKIDGNKIRVHETFDFCTLTVNGKIIDQCRRPIGRTSKQTAYHLKGTFKSEGKRIPVEAKTKRSLLLLYYDGKLVKRQYIG